MTLDPFKYSPGCPSTKTGVGVSIVVFKPSIDKLSQTLRCLKESFSVLDRAGFDGKSTLFLVDNSVPPVDRDVVEGLVRTCYFGMNHPKHQVVVDVLGKNVGYGVAHNRAIQSHCFKYHLILNPDVYLHPNTLTAFFEYTEANNGVVLIGPKVLSLDGSLQYLLRRDPTPIDALLRFMAIFLPALSRLRRYRRYECRDVNMDKVQEGYIMSGCCMWCRTDALRKVGCFDERFFLYWEDYDLSRKLRHIGRIVYLPQAQVVHDWNRPMARNPRLMMNNIRSAITFFRKWGW
ncbi:MAG: glycosyltransferase [Thermodesulforhabdaceae bacterium]